MSLVGPRPLTKDGFNMYSIGSQNKISKVRPGLSGIGSLYFRNEEILLQDKSNINFIYKELIMPYKENLEVWFYNNKSMNNYFKIIFFTVFEVIKPGTLDLFKIFPNLPSPPTELNKLLNTLEKGKKK
jgi:lipopolysaccharide/colanic/teichoic acid biosynthesis glycosyltransferase